MPFPFHARGGGSPDREDGPRAHSRSAAGSTGQPTDHPIDDPIDHPIDHTAALDTDETLVDLRCSVIVARHGEVLLLRRTKARGEEWVLPGGRPAPGESMLACARREVAEETGVSVAPDRCAFVAEVIEPRGGRRRVELVFLANVETGHADPLVGEAEVEPAWVPVDTVRRLNLRPPVSGFLPGVVGGHAPTAPYLGNLWRPDGDDLAEDEVQL